MRNVAFVAVSMLVVACQAPPAEPKSSQGADAAALAAATSAGVTHGLKLASARIELQRAQSCNPTTRAAIPKSDLPELEQTCDIYAEAMKLVFDGTDDHLLGEIK